MSDIRIVCGDPTKGPASFTRFVLPFAYKLEKCDPVSGGQPFYQPLNDVWESTDEKDDFVWRRRYLTDETEEVLFRRAKWFELEPKNWNNGNFKHPFAVLKPPRLVLFEFCLPDDEKQNVPELMQTGFLIVEANCKSINQDGNGHDLNVKLDDFMLFNELFRYWQKPFQGHASKGYKDCLTSIPLNLVTGDRKIGESAKNDDLYFSRWEPFLLLPIKSGSGSDYYRVIPEAWHKNALERINGGYERNKPDWLVHADNRTFVWTCILMEKSYPDKTVYGAEVLKREFGKVFDEIKAEEFGYWTKILNVDTPDGNSSRKFEKEWTDQHTYKRWEELGSFYGYTPHSGAMLGAPFKEPPFWTHFGGMYFDQTLLLLYLKTTLFRFSLKLHQITTEAMKAGEGSQDKWLKDFQYLRWRFTLFANLYQFPLLSNQQQGLEMYTLQRKCMDIDDLFAEIKDEIHSSYEYLMVQQDREQTEQGARLNVVATMGVVGALAFGFLGMNVVGDDINAWCSLDTWNWMTVLGTLIVFIAVTFLILFYSNSIAIRFTKISRYGKKEAEAIRKTIKGDME